MKEVLVLKEAQVKPQRTRKWYWMGALAACAMMILGLLVSRLHPIKDDLPMHKINATKQHLQATVTTTCGSVGSLSEFIAKIQKIDEYCKKVENAFVMVEFVQRLEDTDEELESITQKSSKLDRFLESTGIKYVLSTVGKFVDKVNGFVESALKRVKTPIAQFLHFFKPVRDTVAKANSFCRSKNVQTFRGWVTHPIVEKVMHC
jgi:hypothetical protein